MKFGLSGLTPLGFESSHIQMADAMAMTAGSTVISSFRDGPFVLFFIKYNI
jgi:uncharacterized protein YdaL